MNSSQRSASSKFARNLPLRAVVAATMAACFFIPAGASWAQEKQVHLNPVIAKLAEGKTVYGLNTGDLSVANARQASRSPVDFIYADQQHNPLDFTGLHIFLLGMTDRAMVLKKGNLQPNVALFARFPTEAAESQWIVQQALDMGLMGFIFTDVGTKQDAMAAVQMMRYPQMKGAKYFEPVGKRGNSAANATWIWGLNTEEYMRRADLWPLNPDGDLLAIMMVESAEGLKNVDEIASVPGVGAIFVGAGGDLHLSLGVRQDSPEVEAAFQRILKSCKDHKVACAISANTGADVARRVREGWSIIRSTVPAITAGRALLGQQ